MSNGPYRSTGTIRVRFELVTPQKNANGTRQSQWTTSLFFTPNDDSTVRNRGKQYAVFMPDGGGKARLSKPLGKSGKGVPIKVKADLPALVEAAAQHTLVEVKVKKRKSGWVLRAITIPATSNKK